MRIRAFIERVDDDDNGANERESAHEIQNETAELIL
jgi:hypothetical protein